MTTTTNELKLMKVVRELSESQHNDVFTIELAGYSRQEIQTAVRAGLLAWTSDGRVEVATHLTGPVR